MQCMYMKDQWEGQAAVSCMKYLGFQHINNSKTDEITPHSHYNLLGTLEMYPWKRGAAQKLVRGVNNWGAHGLWVGLQASVNYVWYIFVTHVHGDLVLGILHGLAIQPCCVMVVQVAWIIIYHVRCSDWAWLYGPTDCLVPLTVHSTAWPNDATGSIYQFFQQPLPNVPVPHVQHWVSICL